MDSKGPIKQVLPNPEVCDKKDIKVGGTEEWVGQVTDPLSWVPVMSIDRRNNVRLIICKDVRSQTFETEYPVQVSQ